MPKRAPLQELKDIERELRYIFKQDDIRTVDVNRANAILYRWKQLTEWKEDNTPAINFELIDLGII